IQVATGILLLLYYRPSAEEAYESVQFLMAEVQFGWLIRSIHAWSANLMILALFIHLFSVLLLKAYRRPREITWMSGVALFGVPPAVERHGGPRRTMPFVPDFLLRDMVGWLSALAVLAALAALLPAELGKKADPFAPAPIGIKPEWYFMFMFQTLKYLPSRILGIEGEIVGVVGFGLGGLFLLLIPFLDRRSARGEPSPLFTWIGIAIIAYMIVLTYLG